MVIELRNYLLKPGTRQLFIDYFKEHFVLSQKALGAQIPGMFHIHNEPDRFLWIRQFENMQDRSRFLPAFYGGEIWKEFGPAANDMMLEWHHVYLLKPHTDSQLPFSNDYRIWVLDFYKARHTVTKLIDHLTTGNADDNHLQSSLLVSEMAENDFPRLPVYQDANLLVQIKSYKDEAMYETTLSGVSMFHSQDRLVTDHSCVVLYPVI